MKHHYYFCKKLAFTLPEVLITLGVIGIVAMLVLPTIHAYYFEKMVVAKVKQTYSIMGNAVNMMLNEQECSETSCYNDVAMPDIETIAGRIDKYFKYTVKECVPANGTGKTISWLPEYGYDLKGDKTNIPMLTVAYNGGSTGTDKTDICFYQLNNGVNISINRMNNFSSVGGDLLYILMDANGKSKPNRLGKDVFLFTSAPTSYTDSKKYRLSPQFTYHAWLSSNHFGGMCGVTWAYLKTKCPVSEKTPAAYVLTYDKLPDLTKVGYPAKP